VDIVGDLSTQERISWFAADERISVIS